MKVLGISFGTKNGTNDTVCKVALKGAQEAGAEVEFIQMSILISNTVLGVALALKHYYQEKGVYVY